MMKNKQLAAALVAVLFPVLLAGCATKPPAGQFGFGPRVSERSLYTATIDPPPQPVKARRMMTLSVSIRDAAGNPVEGAQIDVDGGMPQHGHGLPTRPRVTRSLGDGRYQIDGLRFNMGGWWVLQLSVQASGGSDRVTFNLDV